MRVGEMRERLAYVPADSVIAVVASGYDGFRKLTELEISRISDSHQVVFLMAGSEAPEL